MKQRIKRSITLPEVNDNNISYAMRAVQNTKRAKGKLCIDEGYGDYNMTLFRLKDKKKHLKSIPSAFTPNICNLLEYKTTNPNENTLAKEHNQQIKRILSEPKQTYNLIAQKEEIIKNQRLKQERLKTQFVKGQDNQIREYNQHLSFGYLSKHQANNWFTIKDNSAKYRPGPITFKQSPPILFKTHNNSIKKKVKLFRNHIKSSYQLTTIDK